MAQITVYNNGERVAFTTKAYDCVVKKELMREYYLRFAIANNNPARQYIAPGAIFEIGGEQFDITQFYRETGKNNFTEVTAMHVSYRLNDYILEPGYSYMGTIAQIAANLLATAKNGNGTPASSEFSIGTTASLGTIAFSLGNEQEITLRAALLGLQGIGVEVDYSNFTIDLPVRVGAETGKVFRFGLDLANIKRTWNKGDGTTYEVDVASFFRLPGGSPENAFAVGDTVTVEDGYTGEAIRRRIIAYIQDPDNPLNDKLTLGVFVRDNATHAVKMSADINTKITEGEKYNNVSINRTEGFVATDNAGQFKTTQGGAEGFACWVLEDDEWVKKSWMDLAGLVTSKISNQEGGTSASIGTHLIDGYWRSGLRLTNSAAIDVLRILEFAGDVSFYNQNGNLWLWNQGSSSGLGNPNYGQVQTLNFNKAAFVAGANTASGFAFVKNDSEIGFSGTIPSGHAVYVQNGIIVGHSS